MLESFINNFKQKSLLQRFLFFIGLIFLILYFLLGCIFIFFWKNIPLELSFIHGDYCLVFYSLFTV